MQLRFVTIRPLSETLQIQSASTLWWCWGDGARAVQSQEDSAMLPAHRIPHSLGAFALGLFAAFSFAPAHADEQLCTGSMATVTVDNLRVPEGARCTLDGTRIEGNLKIERGASLRARSIRVMGNIQAEGARQVSVAGRSSVGGNVQIKQGGGASILRVDVDGDIQLDENVHKLEVQDNRVGGNIQVFQNRGGAYIAGNVVDGNLQCKENRPAPRGGSNRVDGNREDQCRQL
jgi:hypothetical protein